MGRIKTMGSSGVTGVSSGSGMTSRTGGREGKTEASKVSPSPSSVDAKLKDMLKELHQLTHQVQVCD